MRRAAGAPLCYRVQEEEEEEVKQSRASALTPTFSLSLMPSRDLSSPSLSTLPSIASRRSVAISTPYETERDEEK